ARAQVEDAEDNRLLGALAQHFRVEIGLCRLEREMSREALAELTEKRIAGKSVMNDVGVAKAGVDDGFALDALECPVDRLDRVLARRLGTRLEIRLVDLHDVGARRLE